MLSTLQTLSQTIYTGQKNLGASYSIAVGLGLYPRGWGAAQGNF